MKIQRTCMSDQIRDLVVSRIIDGTYPAGTRLKEMSLAQEFNVSQAPVREALRELEALGLMESERYRGKRVRCSDPNALREAYELRMVLEEQAVRMAVPCSEDHLREMDAMLARLRAAATRGDNNAHADAAIAFHRKIVEASGNRAFLAAWDALHWEVRTRIAIIRVQKAGLDVQSYADKHVAILEAIRAADAVRAAQLIRDLFTSILDALAKPKLAA